MAIKRCLTISFKATTKDLKLYELLNSMEDRSAEVKKVLYDFYFGGKTQDNKTNNSNNIDKILDDEDVPDVMDF
jgi:hypothetical protein